MTLKSSFMHPMEFAIDQGAALFADTIQDEGPGAFGLGTTEQIVDKFMSEAGVTPGSGQPVDVDGPLGSLRLHGFDQPKPPYETDKTWYPSPSSAGGAFSFLLSSTTGIIRDIEDAIVSGLRDVSKELATGISFQFSAFQEQGELKARYTRIYGPVLGSKDPSVRCGTDEAKEACTAAKAAV